jgi:hypothetical protein
MSRSLSAWTSRLPALLREPTLHFFVIGALLFVAHRAIAGDPRTIVITPGVRADVARRFQDHNGHAPSPTELETALGAWKRDEALYREALREQLDRDDATVRTVLADKVRERAAMPLGRLEPTESELDAWLARHRSRYETPPRYDYQFVKFDPAQGPPERQREEYERALAAGANAKELGLPILGGVLTREELANRLGQELSERVQRLPPGKWERAEGQQGPVLVRLNRVEGGLPAKEALRKQLVSDWLLGQRQQAVERGVQEIIQRYRFEERQ